jgi:UDP-glucuronate 4-epimerase
MSGSAGSPRRWIVTGGVGFIGYHLCRALLGRGDHVAIVDDFSDAPYPAAYKERNAADLRREFGEIEIQRACITDRARIEPLFDGANGVFHLAGLAGVRPSLADPARYQRVNVEGTAQVLEVSRARKVAIFIMASSSSVYGNSTPLPAREDEPAVVPESPYAASKRAAELVLASIVRHDPRTRSAALRFFTVYGPRQRPEMAITLFARAILAGRPLTVFGDGSMRRDFTHVDDVVRGILLSADAVRSGMRAFNIGSGAPVTLEELVRALGEAAGRAPSVERAPVPPGDVEATFADVSRARAELGWSPRVPLREGLATVIDWVRANP